MRSLLPHESEFLSTDVATMLRRIAPQADERRLRLFACGCCRQVEPLLTSDELRCVIFRVENLADGVISSVDWIATRETVSLVASSWAREAITALKVLGMVPMPQEILTTVPLVVDHAARALRDAEGALDWTAARRRQSVLLFDIFGKRDQPLAVDPRWLRWNDGTVPKLAEAIYREHRFADMPILADALEEAGCDSAELLDHCRRYPEHARGCWLLDVLRAKS